MENLIKIQNELKAPKNQYNSFGKYKYRSCEDILEAVKPLLLKHDCTLIISDEIKEVGGIVFVEAMAKISDGEKEVIVYAQAGINPDKKGMDISQSFGSSSSYARKYALNGLFLIDDTKDADSKNNSETTETLSKNVAVIPSEILKEITKKIGQAETQDQLASLYKTEISKINQFPSLKGMFTNKKIALNGNS